ncbi:MAG TPA: aminoacetone oxidase family FAD-binding enzyme [Alphaproteobacteria bacterium]|nr:aminoacetone oxidase family FAD-binding enzyme [Alphaproteobacteria bacterium]
MTGSFDVVVIGAGAAGLMCAAEAGRRGRHVCLLDHSHKLAEKIRISGGGRCNFTNLFADPSSFLSENEHFCKSALSRYTQYDFIDMVERAGIAFHEKKLGQLFCDDTAQQIIDVLKQNVLEAGVHLHQGIKVSAVTKDQDKFVIETDKMRIQADSLVVATGGLSIPKIGATDFGYQLARQFDLPVTDVRAGLVPLTFTDNLLRFCKSLSGLSVDAVVRCGQTSFREGLLFTHRGLSGPSVLQISSYWQDGQALLINLAPEINLTEDIAAAKQQQGRADILTLLSRHLPRRLAAAILDREGITGRIADLSSADIGRLHDVVHNWQVVPSGTEGYRTAEVTLGGVHTAALSSKTMEANSCPGLYFIGEVIDVTGHLGGYNFQWAWSSGWVAGQYA